VTALSGKEFARVLERHGWTLARIKGSHHVYTKAGSPPISVPVHGSKALKIGLQRHLMKQAGLSASDL
jgi:predicted RNA binding protein YcfA (HicA-like mRNA interferase family)